MKEFIAFYLLNRIYKLYTWVKSKTFLYLNQDTV